MIEWMAYYRNPMEQEAANYAQEKLLDFLIDSAQMGIDLNSKPCDYPTLIKQLSEMRYQLRQPK